MLSAADCDIEYTMSELAQFGLEAGYLVPTPTGLSKGILDAHDSLRVFLNAQNIHDYRAQGQGEAAKVKIPTEIRTTNTVVQTTTSLYRPETKNGDPRIWVYGLSDVASPGNLLAILPKLQGKLQILLVSNLGLDDIGRADTPIGEAVAELANLRDAPAHDLLSKLRRVSRQGYTPTLREGSTGIGYTLETLLGIAANSSRSPDYRGIEIKAARSTTSGRQTSRVNLFAKTPDWKASRLQSARHLLREFGYPGEDGRPRLYVTVRQTPNAQGLHFSLLDEATLSVGASQGSGFVPAVNWPIKALESALEEKHRETFWVHADVQVIDGREHFHYRDVTYSREPLIANFSPLVLNGTISMDFTIKEKPDGGLRDHGYLFKIFPESRHMLIPKSQNYGLG